MGRKTRWWGVPLVLALIVASAGLLAAQAGDGQPSLYELEPERFFALPRADQPLAAGDVDRGLLAAALFHATNVVRREHGLDPLTFDERLAQAAAIHAESMAEHGYLAHENPHDPERRLPMDRVLLTGYRPRAVSENVAQGFRVRYQDGRGYYRVSRAGETFFSYEPDGDPIPPHTYESFARDMLREWMDSPGHRRNILRQSSEELGTAVQIDFREQDLDAVYAVQVFAQPM